MKKPILLIIIFSFGMFYNVVSQVVTNEEICVGCIKTEPKGEGSSALGNFTKAHGNFSLAGGSGSLAGGIYSLSFGLNDTASNAASIALGYHSAATGIAAFASGYASKAYGDYSTAIGVGAIASGYRAIAIGFNAKADNVNSFAFGKKVYAKNLNSFVIGTGSTYDFLENSIENSLKIGFGSTRHTFFISTATGTDKTGKVGIGDVSNPQAKLHIKSDNNEHATLLIQPGNSSYDAKLFLGDTEHRIVAKPNSDITFHTSTGNDFIFDNGNVGIGTSTPDYTLDVNGDIRFTGDLLFGENIFKPSPWEANGNDIYFNSGNVGIGTTNPLNKFEVIDGSGFLKYDYDSGLNIHSHYTGPDPGIKLSTWSSVNYSWKIISDYTFILENKGEKAEYADLKFVYQDEEKFILDHNGNFNLTGNLIKDGQILVAWISENSGISYLNGNVGIGESNHYSARLIVSNMAEDNKIVAKFKDSDSRRIFMVPKLGSNGFNQLSQPGDIGLFWSDNGLSPEWNANAGFVIGPHNNNDGPKGIRIDKDGHVGIGTGNPDSDHLLTVAGGIHAREVEVTINAGNGADFVFEENYNLPSLTEIENFINQNKHLPQIPSAKQMQEEGLNLGDMQIKLLQKVEELTLYIIEQEKRIAKLEEKNMEE